MPTPSRRGATRRWCEARAGLARGARERCAVPARWDRGPLGAYWTEQLETRAVVEPPHAVTLAVQLVTFVSYESRQVMLGPQWQLPESLAQQTVSVQVERFPFS